MQFKNFNQDRNIREIKRQKWDMIKVIRAKRALVIRLIQNQLIFIIIILIFNGFISLMGSVLFIEIPTSFNFIIIIISFLLLDILFSLITFINFTSQRYYLEAGSFKISGDFVDVKTAKLIILNNFLMKKEDIYRFVDYDHVYLREGLLGKLFNYGRVVIVSSKRQLKNISLTSIKYPEKVMQIIQELIDSDKGDKLIDPSQKKKNESKKRVNTRNASFFYPDNDEDLLNTI